MATAILPLTVLSLTRLIGSMMEQEGSDRPNIESQNPWQ
jgi:hypothetical protein